MRTRWLWLVAALAVVALAGSALVGSPAEPDTAGPPDEQLVSPHDREGYLWPYTSPTRSAADRTLAINVLVRGDPERVRHVFEARSEANWSSVEGEGAIVEGEGNVTDSPWAPARGAARYTYVASDPNETGRWVEANYQLGVGTYLGRRTHVRAYPARVGNWTALQTHTEYWDWFRLRHTVTGVAAGARFVERDLRDEPTVANVSREYHGLDGGGSDGWLTVIDVVPAVATLAALPVVARRRRARDLALPVALAAILLGVRSGGIAAEGLFPSANPKLVAGLLYPVIAAGPPVVVGALARDREPERAALLAVAGLGAGIVLDLSAVGVAVVPVRLVLHRVALLATLALLAFGVARADRRTAAAGLVAWVAALATSLLGVV